MMQCAILVNGDVKYTRKLLDSAFFRDIEGFHMAGVVASAPESLALNRARNLHIPTFIVEEKMFPNGNSYGVALLNKLKDIDSDFVIADGRVHNYFWTDIFFAELFQKSETVKFWHYDI